MPYYPEQTVSKYIYFRDKDDSLTDPDSNTCNVYEPDGTPFATPTLSKIATGTYEMNFNLPVQASCPRGDWTIVVTGTIGTYKGIQRFYFEVELL